MAGIFGLLMSGAGVIKDQYFNLTSLLLPGNGTNGAQNNTFLDSGTANSGSGFTITRNGNTTQGTFSPFSQTGWGAYFDGSNDSCSLASSSDFAIATSTTPFTLEAWVYPLSDNSTFIFAEKFNANVIAFVAGLCDGTSAWSNGRYPQFGYYSGGWTIAASSTTQAALNTWSHVAFVFTGSTSKIYLNGVDVTKSSSPTPATTWGITGNSGDAWLIGVNWEETGNYANAYMSNLRFVNGTAVYTSAFTPSTAPLTAITNTKLLTFQSNRFVDNSSSPKTITPKNGVAITPFSPFAPTQSYSAAAVGGSGYFDGTGDYLELANNSAFDMGTGNFTAEFYVYTQDQTNSYPGILANSTYNATGAVNIRYDNTGNANKFFVYLFGASPADPAITSGTYGFNQWMHVALVRDSSTSLKLYINGVLDGSQTISSGQTVSFGSAASTFLRIGRGFDVDGANGYYAGNVSNVRIVKGQALASGNFTPPTAPVTTSAVGWTGANAAGSLTGTVSLLLNFTNAGVVDATAKNVLETVGNAQISTSVSKFGGGSIAFDGTGDYIPQYGLLLPTTGDFTVEAWIRVDSLSATRTIFGCGSAGTKLAFYVGTSGLVGVQTGSAYLESAGSLIATNTWYHVALTRTSNTYKIFVDGTERTLSGAGTMLTTISNSPQVVGAFSDTFGGSPFSGYMDDFRISMFRRYTSNFTAPTAPFPVQ